MSAKRCSVEIDGIVYTFSVGPFAARGFSVGILLKLEFKYSFFRFSARTVVDRSVNREDRRHQLPKIGTLHFV